MIKVSENVEPSALLQERTKSQTKLTAKSKLLTRMEEDGLVPLQFLTEERKQWKSLKNKPLQRALKYGPIAFLVLGAGAFLGTLALVLPSAAVSQ